MDAQFFDRTPSIRTLASGPNGRLDLFVARGFRLVLGALIRGPHSEWTLPLPDFLGVLHLFFILWSQLNTSFQARTRESMMHKVARVHTSGVKDDCTGESFLCSCCRDW
jgi:hypothetical protein